MTWNIALHSDCAVAKLPLGVGSAVAVRSAG